MLDRLPNSEQDGRTFSPYFLNSVPLLWHRPEPQLEEIERVNERHQLEQDAGVFQKIVGMSRARAWEIVGGLSRASKMPCYSWGIPAQTCITGSKLAQVEGTVCKKCYALKGFFRYPKVQRAYERRLDRSDDPRWVEAMVKLVYWQAAETGAPYFRWFDSGDLQSAAMLHKICAVTEGTPEIRHWLPTREYRIVEEFLREHRLPENLTVRVSAALIDGAAPKIAGLPESTVHSGAVPDGSFVCAARVQEPVNCGACRACWDKNVERVSYPLH